MNLWITRLILILGLICGFAPVFIGAYLFMVANALEPNEAESIGWVLLLLGASVLMSYYLWKILE